jgi:hypothetical protein
VEADVGAGGEAAGALAVAFGLTTGQAPNTFLVGLAVLGLLTT